MIIMNYKNNLFTPINEVLDDKTMIDLGCMYKNIMIEVSIRDLKVQLKKILKLFIKFI